MQHDLFGAEVPDPPEHSRPGPSTPAPAPAPACVLRLDFQLPPTVRTIHGAAGSVRLEEHSLFS